MNTQPSDEALSPRVKRPQRAQKEWRDFSLEEFVPADDRVRIVWRYVERLDLSHLYAKIRAVEGAPGRDAVDPRILVALWLYALIEGYSSAREIERLCKKHLCFMWLCGNVGVNHHLLSDFFTEHEEFLFGLLTNSIATLMHQKLITLETVAQDGMRVRANAGKSSFRRRETLEGLRDQAEAHVKRLRTEGQQDSGVASAARQAAQERAAREREQRIADAIAALPELEQKKAIKDRKRKKEPNEKKSEARASTTDPEARVMKTADGGFRPAYNVQFVTDAETRMVVGVDVTNSGSDRGQMTPLAEQLAEIYGKTPDNYLVDCGFATKEEITTMEQMGSGVIAPIHGEQQMKKRGVDPHARQPGDTPEMLAFRQRMATEEAKALKRLRPSVAEFVNAECRNRGLQQFRVRGLKKARVAALWYALAFNLMRMIDLEVIQ